MARHDRVLGALPDQRAQVGDQPIVTGSELEELAAARSVLILERTRLAGGIAEQRRHQLLVDARQLLAGARKKATERGVAMLEGGGARGSELERGFFAAQTVQAPRGDTLAANRPGFVAQVLLQGRDLALHRQHDVRQPRLVAAVRRDAAQHPGAALLVHQAARAVDRVDQDPPARSRGIAAARQRQRSAGDALGDEHDAPEAFRIGLEPADQHVFADAIDGVDGVALPVARDCCRRVDGGLGAGLEHPGADRSVHVAQELADRFELAHVPPSAR